MVTKKKAAPKKKVVKKKATVRNNRTVKKKAVKKKVVKKTAVKKPRKPTSESKKTIELRYRSFALEYIIDFNATRAAEVCGYSKKTAPQQGSRLLSKVKVQEYISEFMKERSDKTKVDAEYVLTRLHDMAEADPMDIMDDETGAFKPIKDWTPVWPKMSSAIDIKEIMEYQREENGMVKVGDMVKFKFPERLRILEVLGKHVDVQAFLQKVEVTEGGELAERLRRARDRAQGKHGKHS